MTDGKNSPEASLDAYITFLNTTNLVKTSEFYEKTLGLRLVLDQGGCRIYQVAPGAFVGFCERESPGPVQGVILTLVTEAVEKQAFWSPMLEPIFKGPDDPDYGIIVVTPYRIELVNAGEMKPEVWEA